MYYGQKIQLHFLICVVKYIGPGTTATGTRLIGRQFGHCGQDRIPDTSQHQT